MRSLLSIKYEMKNEFTYKVLLKIGNIPYHVQMYIRFETEAVNSSVLFL